MNGLGFSAMLISMLRRPKVPGLDEDIACRDTTLRRFGWLLGLEVLLFAGLTLAALLR
jgi:hypothetical protein